MGSHPLIAGLEPTTQLSCTGSANLLHCLVKSDLHWQLLLYVGWCCPGAKGCAPCWWTPWQGAADQLAFLLQCAAQSCQSLCYFKIRCLALNRLQ